MQRIVYLMLLFIISSGVYAFNGIQATTPLFIQNGETKVYIEKGTIIPFEVIKETDKTIEARLVNGVMFPAERKDYIFDKQNVAAVKVSLTKYFEISKVNDIVEIMKKYNSSKFDNDLEQFLAMQHLIIQSSRRAKIEEIENSVYAYFTDSKNEKYINCMILNKQISEDIAVFRPLLAKYRGKGVLMTDLINLSQSKGHFFIINYDCELSLFVKLIEDTLSNFDRDTAYKDIIAAISEISGNRILDLKQKIEKNEKLQPLNLYLSILRSFNKEGLKVYIRDYQMPEVLRTYLLINFINNSDNAYEIRNEMKEYVMDNKILGIEPVLFDLLPLKDLTKTITEISKDVLNKKEMFKTHNEALEFIEKRYKELMNLKDLNKGNQVLSYLYNYTNIVGIRRYADYVGTETEKDKVILFGTLYRSLEDKKIFISVIEELKRSEKTEVVGELYATSLAYVTLIEMDNIIFSKLFENGVFRENFEDYIDMYEQITKQSNTAASDIMFANYLNKKLVAEAIKAKTVEGLDGYMKYVWEISTKYPSNVGDMYAYLSRTIKVLTKLRSQDEKYIKELDKIETQLKELNEKISKGR